MTTRPRVLTALLALVCLAAVVGLVLVARDRAQLRQTARDRQAALDAAQQEAVAITSISDRTSKADIDRIVSGATGELAQQFGTERDQLTQLLGSSRSTSKGQVLAAAVQHLQGRSATVLVATDATVTTAQTGEDKPVLQRYRMSMDLRKVGDHWLAERVLFAGAPS